MANGRVVFHHCHEEPRDRCPEPVAAPSTTDATCPGSSQVGMCPQPRSSTPREPSGRCRGGATSRSSSPQASVTGASISCNPENTADRIAAFAPSKPGAVTYARTSRAAACGGTRSGCPTELDRSARRPRTVRTSAGTSGSSARPRRRTSGPDRMPSGRPQKPAGQRPVTEQGAPEPAELEGHPAAERVAGHVHAVEAERVEQATDGGGQRLRGGLGSAGERRRGAEAGQVDGDHVALGGEALHHRLPDHELGPERMDQDERFTPSRPYVVEETLSHDEPRGTDSARDRLEPRHRPSRGRGAGRAAARAPAVRHPRPGALPAARSARRRRPRGPPCERRPREPRVDRGVRRASCRRSTCS